MKIFAVGGYDEIGKNMTCIESEGEALILDIGLHIENLMGQDYDVTSMTRKELRQLEVLPDDRILEGIKDKVVGIVIGHGHLDHIGAVTKIAHTYDCPIFVTPFSAEILRGQCMEEKNYKLERDIRVVKPGETVRMGRSFSVEFVPAAHSIPDTTISAIHTEEGTVIYANDYKFDHDVTLGHETNTERLAELGKAGVKALIFDTTRVERPGHTGNEDEAVQKIRNAMAECDPEGGIIATTFASHILRHQNIILAATEMNRRVIFLGRSMEKYIACANRLGLLDLMGSRVFGRKNSMERALGKAEKKKFVFIVTGNQGEPNSVLDRISRGELPYDFSKRNDSILFCCEVIPTETNRKCRDELERRLSPLAKNIFRDLHVSGHAAREDVRKMLTLTKPEHVIPTHGGRARLESARDLALEEGFPDGNIHLLHDGEMLEIK